MVARATSEDGKFKPQTLWTKNQEFRTTGPQQLEDELARFLQNELPSIVRVFPKKDEGKLVNAASLDPSKDEYHLNWNDPDPVRNHFFAGITGGTPAIGNAVLGYWGSKEIPIVVAASGMFWSYSTRGFEFDTGVAVANTGEFKQVVGASLSLLNQDDSMTNPIYNDFGIQTGSTNSTTHTLFPYLGPFYQAEWRNIRAQVGVGTRLNSDAQSAFRFLFQVGYAIPWRF